MYGDLFDELEGELAQGVARCRPIRCLQYFSLLLLLLLYALCLSAVGIIFYLHFFLDIALILVGEGESLNGSGQDDWQVLLEAVIEVILIFDHLDHDVAPALLQLSPSCHWTVPDQQLQHFLAQQ